MTAPIMLPRKRGVKTDKVHMVDFGGQLKPFLGGPVQTIMRLGTRWAVDVTIPIMRAEPDGRQWAAALSMGKIYGVAMHFRQDGLKINMPGTSVAVDGAGQTGFALAMRGFRPGYAIRQGQAFSIVTVDRRYLYFAAASGVVGSDGKISLPIYPMLRVSPVDGDTCEWADPIIQGSLSGNDVSWTRMTAPFFDFGTITITEDE
jgi:hypothetical protein